VGERNHSADGSQPVSAAAGIFLPVAVLVVAIAVVSGLVFGGVLQGRDQRVGPHGPSTTQSTILIEP
jgi:hypothetical protein